MSENAVVPTSLNGWAVEINIVFNYAVVVMHSKVVEVVFTIGSRVNEAKLST